MKVVIRADASVEIGTGHVMRCLTLAEELKNRGAVVEFACVPLTGNLIELIRTEGYVCHVLSKLEALLHAKGDWLVVDHYGIDAAWETLMRKQFNRIFVIDDLYNRIHDCDALLDYNLHAMQEVDLYQQIIVKTSNPKKLYGPQYVLLNKEFTQLRQSLRVRKHPIKKILIAFGGSDPTNETPKAIEAIVGLGKNANIVVDVVVGNSNPQRSFIRELCEKQANFVYHQQVKYIAELMWQADLAIGAGGVMTWERYAMGLPAITIAIASNQFVNLELGNLKKSLLYLGTYECVNVESLQAAINMLAINEKMLRELSRQAAMLVDCKGCKRVVDFMVNETGSDG